MRLACHTTRTLLGLAAAAAIAGCGGGGNGTDPDAAGSCEPTGRYADLVVGATTNYRVTDPTNPSAPAASKTQTVFAKEDVGGAKAGVMANRVVTTKPGGMTISWQEDTGDTVIRHREQDMAGATMTDEIYDPSKLRLDETAAHMTAGASWQVAYTETVTTTGIPTPTMANKTENWDVVAVDEMVTVPAGTFCSLHVHRVSMVGATIGSDKQYWWARGVGKLKEEGDSQIEELVSFTR